MPTYEYHCPKCKTSYDLRQGFDAPTTHSCENCGKGLAKRVLHAPKVFFKGSGFYVTDSKSKSSAAVTDATPATSDASGNGSGGGDPGAGPATKSAAGPESKPEKAAAAAKPSATTDSAAS